MDELNPSNEENKWIEEISCSNGIELGKTDLKSIESVEYFLTQLPYIPSTISLFPCLTVLRLVGSNISKIQHLENLVNLKELWICEAKLEKIECLGKCYYIESLYLYDNKIKRIENVSHLLLLKTLWLNKNLIERVEGLGELQRLKILNLSDNRIKHIDPCINKNISLEELNLSGNCISSFKDVMNLSQLPYLRSLSFKDPMSLPNPVSFLCNYSTYVLYHIPTLTRLDAFDVHQKNLKDLAEAIVMKKKMFYNMKIKTKERMLSTTVAILKNEMEKLQEPCKSSLFKLINAVKEAEREIQDLEKRRNSEMTDQERNYALNKFKEKLKTIKDRISYWEDRYKRCYSDFCNVERQAKQWITNDIECIKTEYSTGGNVRFEEGTDRDPWYTSCQELIYSRFFGQEFKDHSITGIKVHKITRVLNRISKLNFDTKFDLITGGSDTMSVYRDSSGKRVIDYLFLVFDQKSMPQSNILRLLENGFQTPENQKSPISYIQATNSIQLADKQRIKTLTQKVDVRDNEQCPFRFGQLVICKTYLGKSTSVTSEKRISKSLYPSCDSVFRTRKHQIASCPNKTKKNQNSDQCECTARRCTWYIFDPDMILMEYIIDFEYLSMETPDMTRIFSNLNSSSKISVNETEKQKNSIDEQVRIDDEILSMQPFITSKPRLTVLSEELLLKQSKESELSRITDLNLHGSGLSKVKILHTLTNLKKLILSFNELSSLSDLAGITSLDYLDVSFNQISGFEGFKVAPHLSYLDISWNKFYYTREEVGLMRKYLPALKILRCAYNPWLKINSLRLRCIGRLRSLIVMDDKVVTEEETKTALRLAAGSRIAYITTLAYSRTDNELPRTLSLATSTEILMKNSLNKPVKLSEDDKLWFAKVTCLHLDNQHLSKISNLEKLENLKWLSLCNNDITKIEGLETCTNLVEVLLSGNCISRVEGINHLKQLELFDISDNNVSSLDSIAFDNLPELRHLAFHNNFVMSIQGLQFASSLIEVYAGNNEVQYTREIFKLKNLANLIILDLMGNPLSKESQYRLFTIYHLQHLKVLDGKPVTHGEGLLAKEAFGGKLSTDFITERLGHSNFLELCELDLPNCNLQSVDLPGDTVFKNLRSLNLEQNSLTHFGGIINLVNLRVFHENSFRDQWKLVELHVEENRLKDLSNLQCLSNLRRLYIGINKIQDMTELEKLECFSNLFELSVIGNPVARRLLHRPLLVFRQPNLLSIDGIPVTNDERAKAELYFIEQQGGLQALQAITASSEQPFPGLIAKSKNPLKVSNYLGSVSRDNYWLHSMQNISGGDIDTDVKGGAKSKSKDQYSRNRSNSKNR